MLELKLPELPYPTNALAPVMSEETFSYHYSKHHNAYVTNGNKLIKASGMSNMRNVEEALRESFIDKSKAAVFNNVAQHWNHYHFWNWMKPEGGGPPTGAIANRIDASFGSYEAFRNEFINAGFFRFGSGWVWLVQKSSTSNSLMVTTTANGENPLVYNQWPLLGCDVWEHSYYIDYRNDRRAYLEAFVDSLINWDYVNKMINRQDMTI